MSGIVVGVDGSEGSRRALEWALDEAAIHDVPVKVIHAWMESMRDYFTGDTVSSGERERAATEFVERVVHDAQAPRHDQPPVRTHAIAINGDPRVVLTAAAESADLLVVGSRGSTGPLGRFFLGSTATFVTRHAPCPVTVVPAPDDHSR